MSGERYHPQLGSATLIIASIITAFILLNTVFGPWPGHFGEKLYGMPLLLGIFGVETSQPIWGPTGVFSSQEYLLLTIVAITGGVSYWARRYRPDFVVPTGMTLSEHGEREFAKTQVGSQGIVGQNPATSSIVESIIGRTPTADASTEKSFAEIRNVVALESPALDNLSQDIPTPVSALSLPKLEESTFSAPISGVGGAREFGGVGTVENVPLPGADSNQPPVPDLPETPSTTTSMSMQSVELPHLPALGVASASSAESSNVPLLGAVELPTVPMPVEIPSLPVVEPVVEIISDSDLPALPSSPELEELVAFPELELDLPSLPSFTDSELASTSTELENQGSENTASSEGLPPLPDI